MVFEHADACLLEITLLPYILIHGYIYRLYCPQQLLCLTIYFTLITRYQTFIRSPACGVDYFRAQSLWQYSQKIPISLTGIHHYDTKRTLSELLLRWLTVYTGEVIRFVESPRAPFTYFMSERPGSQRSNAASR